MNCYYDLQFSCKGTNAVEHYSGFSVLNIGMTMLNGPFY